MTPGVLKRIGERRLDRRLADVSQEIRQSLDTEETVRLSAHAVHDVVRPERTSIWLTTGDRPRLAYSINGRESTVEQMPVPPLVLECARRRRPTVNPLLTGVAVPIVAPHSGFLGVIHLDRMASDREQQQFIEAIAREASLALETANLYERAVSEKEKTEAVLARVADGVVVTDVKGNVLQLNKAAARIFECPEQTSGRSHGCALLGLREDDRALDCTQGCALLASGRTQDRELWRKHSDSRRQPLLATAEVVNDRAGNISEIVHSFRDVTRLKEADEAKTLFLATASHELKTPLTVIRGFAETLLSEQNWDEADKQKALEAMGRRTLDLSKIVDRILLSSRIEAGRTHVSVAEVDLKPVLVERAEALKSATGREVLAEIEDDLPSVLADPDALTTVIDHLLDNAVKYSPDGGPINVAALADDSLVRLSIRDEGIGMDSEQLSHCFERFWQAESSDVRRFGGTGIGLYIVQSLVEAMGGEISAESASGEGTTFRLDLVQAGASNPARPTAAEPPTPGTGDPSVIREFMRQIGIPARMDR
jgi:PAS domain S-box-containing protein